MLASGDLPDIVLMDRRSDIVNKYIAAGALVPLNDLIDQYGADIQEMSGDCLLYTSLSPEDFSEALALLFPIRGFVHKNDYDAAYPAFVRILSLLDDSCRENILKTSDAEKKRGTENPPLIAEVITYINQNYSTIRCLDDISDVYKRQVLPFTRFLARLFG